MLISMNCSQYKVIVLCDFPKSWFSLNWNFEITNITKNFLNLGNVVLIENRHKSVKNCEIPAFIRFGANQLASELRNAHYHVDNRYEYILSLLILLN